MRYFTAEESNWIEAHYWDAPPKELCEQFNNVFEPRDQNTFRHHNPPNGWGNIDSAKEALRSLRNCICEHAEEIPLKCLYMRW